MREEQVISPGFEGSKLFPFLQPLCPQSFCLILVWQTGKDTVRCCAAPRWAKPGILGFLDTLVLSALGFPGSGSWSNFLLSLFGWQLPCVEILHLSGSFSVESRSTAWNIIIEQLLLKPLAWQKCSYPENIIKCSLCVWLTFFFFIVLESTTFEEVH